MHVTPERIDLPRLREILLKDLVLSDCLPILTAAAQSELLLAYWAEQRLLAIVGFVPQGMLTSTAYIWLETTPAAKDYPVAVGRWGIWTLREVRKRWSRIIGHCVVGSNSIAWLTSLGAKFHEPQGQALPFTIGD